MKTATVEMTRDGAYIVVVFRPKPFAKKVPTADGARSRREMFYTPLPADFFAFASEWCLADAQNGVGIRLAKDASGVDVTPMLVAADALRDAGWTVEPIGWCKSEMERRCAA